MFKKLTTLLFVMPIFSQSVHSESAEKDDLIVENDVNKEDDSLKKTIEEMNNKIQRKSDLSKKIGEMSEKMSKCKNPNDLEKLTKKNESYMLEITKLEDEEIREGLNFKQRRVEAVAIKEKDFETIEMLVNKLIERKGEFLIKKKDYEKEISRRKKVSPEQQAIFRENLNNINLGITNLETKIEKLRQLKITLRAEKKLELEKKREEAYRKYMEIAENSPSKKEFSDQEERNKYTKQWPKDLESASMEWKSYITELQRLEESMSVDESLESMGKENSVTENAE